jgi:nucleoside phosphorylase
MQILILTPISVEYRAVRAHLSAIQSKMYEGQLYETGQFQGKAGTYQVTIRETGSKNSIVALAVERAIRLFNPELVFLTGIAGSIKDANIGDIVVGTKAYGYESGKDTQTGVVARPDVLPYNNFLIETARMVSRNEEWRKRTSDQALGARVFFGPIASGDKVITTTDSPLYHYLKQHYNDTLALEMESIGFTTAMANYPNLPAANIRGISDLLDHKSDNFQQMASERAAAFLFELLYCIDMPVKDVTNELTKDKSPNIYANKNIIVDSTIAVGGNLHIGDQSLTRGIQTSDNEKWATRNNILDFIAKGKVDDAIKMTLATVEAYNVGLAQEARHLSDRWMQLAKKRRMGTISNAEAIVEHNQITANLLELIEQLT